MSLIPKRTPRAPRSRTLAAAVLACLLALPAAFAEDDNSISLVIAPPPVGYPVLERGKSDTQMGVNLVYASFDSGGSDLTMLGSSVFGNFQACPASMVGLSGSVGATFLAGDRYDMMFLQVPVSGTLILAPLNFRHFSLFLFGTGTLTAGMTNMTKAVPQSLRPRL